MGSKQKGSLFERQVCKRLSLWVSGGRDPDMFWRSASSGGRATRRGGSSLGHAAGDIASVKPGGFIFTTQFYVECKHYHNLQLGHFLTSGNGKLEVFWTVARRESSRYNRRPLLIAKQDLAPAIVVMEWRTLRDLELLSGWSVQGSRQGEEVVVVIGFEEMVTHGKVDFLSRRVRLAPQHEEP